MNAVLHSWSPELSPRLASYAQRHFIEFGAGYGFRLIDLWMLMSHEGQFTINAYYANGTATPVTATTRNRELTLQGPGGPLLPPRPLLELRRLINRAIEQCMHKDGRRLETLRFSDETPPAEDLRDAIREDLSTVLDNDLRCAALMDDGLPMITTYLFGEGQVWLLLFKVDDAIHVRVADSLPGLAEPVRLLQLVGLWPADHVTLSRIP
jgi:hypothetical protein